MEREDHSCPSPRPIPSSSIFKDLSNFKTPKRPPQVPNFQTPSTKFFTSSKQTPCPSSSFLRHRPSVAPSSSASRSKAVRKLKAFELEQSQSSRKVQIRKEQSLKSLAKSLTVWLNFLFENPRSCGCDWPKVGEADPTEAHSKGKRDCRSNEAVGVDASWRCPKRHRDISWQPVGQDNEQNTVDFSFPKMSKLRESLKDICSFDDLMQRMRLYLNLKNCEDVCKMMAQLTKNIDDGRLKMKVHCPIVTDVGLKEKATQVLMSYNPSWLRIGLFVIFGGDTLLSDEDMVCDQETSLLKMIIDKQLLAHSSLAKAYSYNKMVEGLYRPGYYENLGKIILKRFLFLVLILDKVKCQTSLPSKYGIDGVDGGSPLLFKVQSGIKSSSQMIQDFLPTDVMHGEGNLISHLVIVGYKVSYQQDSLSEYSFKITDLFVDIQDGVRLCRALQIFQNNSSMMMKISVPSDTRKKNLANCTIALQNLKQAGVMMCDEDGMEITGGDIVDRDKELILSILWNMFVHFQLPLLINKTLMLEEVCKIRGQENIVTINSTPLEMLFNWIKEICNIYNLKIDSFSALIDGKGIWCLLDYYFRKDLTCSLSMKDPNSSRMKESIMSANDYPDAAHNFIMSSKLTKILGNFPEILQISDILEFQGVSSDRSVVIFLVFLASELIVNRSVERLNFHKFLGCDCRSSDMRHLSSERCRFNGTKMQDGEELGNEDFATKFKVVQSWWKKMVDQNRKSLGKSNSPSHLWAKKNSYSEEKENAVKILQSHGRRYIIRQRYLKSINNIIFLQTFIRHWSNRRKQSTCIYLANPETFLCETNQQPQPTRKYIMFTIDGQSFLNSKQSVLLIQQASSNWIAGKNLGGVMNNSMSSCDLLSAVIVIQKYVRRWLLRSRDSSYVSKMEESSIKSLCTSDQLREASDNQLDGKEICRLTMADNTLFNQHLAAIKIQSNYRRWLSRMLYVEQQWATTIIQKNFRMIRSRKSYKILVASVIIIQSFVRRWIVRRFVCRQRHLITIIQCNCRVWLIRRQFIIQQEAAVKIQSVVRCMIYWKGYNLHRQAAIEIQRLVRGKIVRSRLIGASRLQADINHGNYLSISGGCSIELKIFLLSVIKLQRWWRSILRSKSAVIIQSHTRGWIARRKVASKKNCVVVIQCNCRGWLIRRQLIIQQEAAVKIQSAVRCMIYWKGYNLHRQAAIEIQRLVRGKIVRSRLIGASRLQADINHGNYLSISGGCSIELKIFLLSVIKLQRWWRSILRSKSAVIIQSHTRGWIARRKVASKKNCVVVIQCNCRGWLIRRQLIIQQEAAVKIQSAVRCMIYWKGYNLHRQAAIEIQRLVRGKIVRSRLIGASRLQADINHGNYLSISGGCSIELKIFLLSVIKLQRWWRSILRSKSAVIIQSHTRGWIARRKVASKKNCVVVIQSYWRGYLVRRESKEQLLDLCLNLQQSANVHDHNRAINRLVKALPDLLKMTSVRGILHICASLDTATKHSSECCETLVAAGVIDTILKLICSISRSIPDQQILKHALSTLRNIARYSHLTQVLIETRGSIEMVILEFLRNKEEVYFIASELLKKMCASDRGIEVVRKSPAFVRRLQSLVNELTRKISNQKKNDKGKENIERRLREAVQLLKLITA